MVDSPHLQGADAIEAGSANARREGPQDRNAARTNRHGTANRLSLGTLPRHVPGAGSPRAVDLAATGSDGNDDEATGASEYLAAEAGTAGQPARANRRSRIPAGNAHLHGQSLARLNRRRGAEVRDDQPQGLRDPVVPGHLPIRGVVTTDECITIESEPERVEVQLDRHRHVGEAGREVLLLDRDGGDTARERPGERSRLRLRSEERRVGKECRSRWSPYH